MHIPQWGSGVQRAVRTPASLLLTHPCPHSPVPTACLCRREDSRDPTWAGLGGRAHLAQGCCPGQGWARLPGHELRSPIRSAPCSKCLLRITCACSSVQIQWDPASVRFLGAAQPSMGTLGITGLEEGTVPTRAELGFLSMCTTSPTPTHESSILSLSLIHTHTHICTYMHTLIHTDMLTQTHTHVHTYTDTHSHRHTQRHRHTHSHIHTHCYTLIHTQIHTHSHIHAHAHTIILLHTHAHTHMLTHTHMLIHTQTHTHTRSHRHTLSYTHTDSLIHTRTLIQTFSHTHTRTLMYMHTLTQTHSLIHTDTHTLSYTHTETHTYTLLHLHTHTLSLTHTQTHTVCSRAHRVRIQVQAPLALTPVCTGPPLLFLRGLSPAAPAAARVPQARGGTHPCFELSWEPGAPWHQQRRPPALTDLLRTAGT